jgi:oligoribonuclease NrnB/cAMP/cGMP phosphodiesterase (DHH superfamily)
MKDKPLAVIHGSACRDGFACGTLIKHVQENGADIVFEDYSDRMNLDTDRIKGRDMYILDYCYDYEVIERIITDGRPKSLTMLDHHQSSRDTFQKIDEFVKKTKTRGVHLNHDESKSGCLLTAEYLVSQGKLDFVPDYIKYISDRDLWNFDLPFCREVNAFIHHMPMDFHVWCVLTQKWMKDPKELLLEAIEVGQHYCEYEDAIMRYQLKRVSSHDIKFGEEVVCMPVVAFCLSVSATLEKLYQQHPHIAMHYSIITDKSRNDYGNYVFSLRSLSGKGPDVASLAEVYGGGGHANAAGFFLPPDQARELLSLP